MLYVDLQRSGDEVNAYGIRHYGGLVHSTIDAEVTGGHAFNSAPGELMASCSRPRRHGRVLQRDGITNRDARYWMMAWRTGATAEDERAGQCHAEGAEPMTSGFYVNALTGDENARALATAALRPSRRRQGSLRPDEPVPLNANVLPTAKTAA
jgi:hypothetical protein